MIELLTRFLPRKSPAGVRAHVRQMGDITGGQPGHDLLVIGLVVEQLELDVDAWVRLFKSIHDAQPVDPFRI